MTDLKIYLITYDRLLSRAVEKLKETEKQCISCYTVQKGVEKNIVEGISIINEWEFTWNDFSYQKKQYYEYGSFVHLLNNHELIKNLTHIGILHYDVMFEEDSVNEIKNILDANPRTIFYNKIRYFDELYLTPFELYNICEFLNQRLNMMIDYRNILQNGWVSECLSVVPIDVFEKFATFLRDYRNEIEDILLKNQWGIMNVIPHRICGIIERMWGIYLISQNLNMRPFNIKHDWDFYTHKHQEEENWIKK
jgi:hypothetical protein